MNNFIFSLHFNSRSQTLPPRKICPPAEGAGHRYWKYRNLVIKATRPSIQTSFEFCAFVMSQLFLWIHIELTTTINRVNDKRGRHKTKASQIRPIPLRPVTVQFNPTCVTAVITWMITHLIVPYHVASFQFNSAVTPIDSVRGEGKCTPRVQVCVVRPSLGRLRIYDSFSETRFNFQ